MSENTWFPIASATLKRHVPAVHQKVFPNLTQTDGLEVLISVETFLRRVAALRTGNDEERRAVQLLARRGLTDATLARARALLDELTRPQVPLGATAHHALEADADAGVGEAELWAWYLEWSQIAPIVIKDKRLLRELGFLRPVRSAGGLASGVDDEDDDDDEEALAGDRTRRAAPRRDEDLEEDPLDREIAAAAPTAPRKRPAPDPAPPKEIRVGFRDSNPFTE